MGHENPLITLGVPKRVLVHEQAFGTPADVLKLAEANYRTLSRRYHPDFPGGDADLMTELGDAINELRDPDALEFYINEIVGEDDIEGLYQQKQAQKLVTRDDAALSHLARGYAFIDQFAALGITEPTSFFAEMSDLKIVIDVVSPSEARARVIDPRDDTDPLYIRNTSKSNDETSYSRGNWRMLALFDDRKRWQVYSHYVGDESVKLVGYIGARPHRPAKTVPDMVRMQLDTVVREPKVDWIVAKDCWFLPKLHFADSPQLGAGLVLYKDGRFAVVDKLLGFASIKN